MLDGRQDIVKPQRDGPSTEELVCGAVAVLEKVPSAAHSLAELLLAHCTGRPERAQALMACLAARFTRQESPPPPHKPLLAAAHLAAVLCDMSVPMRIAGVDAGRRGLCSISNAKLSVVSTTREHVVFLVSNLITSAEDLSSRSCMQKEP